jgi:hypothetical protein
MLKQTAMDHEQRGRHRKIIVGYFGHCKLTQTRASVASVRSDMCGAFSRGIRCRMMTACPIPAQQCRSQKCRVGMALHRSYRDGVAALTPQLLADSDSSRSRLREVNGTAGSRVRRSRSAARRRSPLSGGKPEGSWAANPCSGTTRNRGIPALQNLVRKTRCGQMVERKVGRRWNV